MMTGTLISLAGGFENRGRRALCFTLLRETRAIPLSSETSDFLWVAKTDGEKINIQW